MKSVSAWLVLVALFLLLSACQQTADRAASLRYEPDSRYPFGRPNPEAPPQLAQFAFMIGHNDCREERLNNDSGEWDSSERTWDAYYYMNGFAIRDGGRSGVNSNGNIRIYDSATAQWRVSYFSMPNYSSAEWSGGLEGDRLVLRRPQQAPGTEIDGFSRLTFLNISATGFDWTGEWVSADGSVEFLFWRVSCRKRS